MDILSVALLICFIPGIIQGISKGFVKQVISLAALFIGILVARKYCAPAAEILGRQFAESQPAVVNALAFAIIWLLSVLVLNLIGNLLTKILKTATLGGINRLFGVIFAIFKTAIILALLVSVFDAVNGKWELVSNDTLDASPVYAYLRDLAERFLPFLKNLFTPENA